MSWTQGDVSGGTVLTDEDHLYNTHINEIRERIDKRKTTITSSGTPTPDMDITDIYIISALATPATFGAPTGTPVDGQSLIIRIKDDGTARALTFNSIYRASSDLSLPSTTTVSKTMYLGFIYNGTDNKYDLLAKIDNF